MHPSHWPSLWVSVAFGLFMGLWVTLPLGDERPASRRLMGLTFVGTATFMTLVMFVAFLSRPLR